MLTTMVFVVLLAVTPALGQANIYHNNERIEVTSTSPFLISGGPCWEAVRFESGFVANRFRAVALPSGDVQVIWTIVVQLDNGVGAVSGGSYSMKENFNYTYHLQKGQYVLPQRLFFRLTQSSGEVITVEQASVLLYDPDTNITKVVVDTYEVSCP